MCPENSSIAERILCALRTDKFKAECQHPEESTCLCHESTRGARFRLTEDQPPSPGLRVWKARSGLDRQAGVNDLSACQPTAQFGASFTDFLDVGGIRSGSWILSPTSLSGNQLVPKQETLKRDPFVSVAHGPSGHPQNMKTSTLHLVAGRRANHSARLFSEQSDSIAHCDRNRQVLQQVLHALVDGGSVE